MTFSIQTITLNEAHCFQSHEQKGIRDIAIIENYKCITFQKHSLLYDIITSFENFYSNEPPELCHKTEKHPAELHTTICRALQNKCMFPAILLLHLKDWVLQINAHLNKSCETFNKGQYHMPSTEHLVQLCFKMDETILFSILLASRDIQFKHTTLTVNPTRFGNYIYISSPKVLYPNQCE